MTRRPGPSGRPGQAADPFRHEDKRSSWNDYGAEYWTLAGASSHPSPQESDSFLAGAGPGRRVLVLGATTRELIRAALALGAEVHVLDFAERLLSLAAQEFGPALHTHEHDLNDPAPTGLDGAFDLVLADRLLNRFHRTEMGAVLANMASFLKPSGELRTSVRFGLYPLDERLIARGTELGTVKNFWDETTRTLDWSKVGRELDDVAEAHGDIPREIVIAWSRKRGVESRITPADMDDIAAEASAAGRRVHFTEVIAMDTAPQSKLYVAVARGR